jgi:GrpB-like predicted nucleotidyltransferase (UPF0157 family)
MSRAPVILEESDSSWNKNLKKEKGHLMAIAGEFYYGSIEYVGSAAVPGMVAKLVIEVMFVSSPLKSPR